MMRVCFVSFVVVWSMNAHAAITAPQEQSGHPLQIASVELESDAKAQALQQHVIHIFRADEALRAQIQDAYRRRDAALLAKSFDASAYAKADQDISALTARRRALIGKRLVHLAEKQDISGRRLLSKALNTRPVRRLPDNVYTSKEAFSVTNVPEEPAYFRDIRAALLDIRRRDRVISREYRAAFIKRAKALASEPFDKQAFLEAEARLINISRRRAEARRNGLVNIAGRFSAQERKTLMQFLKGPRPRRFR